MKWISLTLSFNGSHNYAIEDYGENTLLIGSTSAIGKFGVQANMRPFTRHFIARLAAIDKAKTGVLKMTPVW